MDQKIKIHFVCNGNMFRSRVAQAYARSLKSDEWEVSSSGILADRIPNRQLSPWAKIMGHQQGFTEFFSDQAVQTTTEILQANDIIVFMAQDVFDNASQWYDFKPEKSVVWHVKDREDWQKNLPIDQKRKRTFKTIKRNVDQLVKDISRGGWVDIVNEKDDAIDVKLPISIANKKGLWHRTCHVIITTPSNHTLVQKRSNSIIFAPSMIDVTLGGHVDAGETPEHAMIREIREEIGLQSPTADLRLLEVYKLASYHPKYKRYTKCFTYTYHLPLQDNEPAMALQSEEVAAMKLVSSTDLKRLIRTHRLKNFGRLNYPYAYYLRIIALVDN